MVKMFLSPTYLSTKIVRSSAIQLELIYADGSNCAQRIRWALNYKDMEYQLLNYEDLDHQQLLQLSPLGKVPAMIADGQSFAESVAMLEFVEELKPQPSLLPGTPILRVKVREAVEMINGWIHPIQCSSVPRFFIPELNDKQVKAFRLKWLQKYLRVLHDELLFRDSDFAIGSTFTWADLSVIPIYTKALVLGLDREFFPKFSKHIGYCMSDTRIRETCPEDLAFELNRRNFM